MGARQRAKGSTLYATTLRPAISSEIMNETGLGSSVSFGGKKEVFTRKPRNKQVAATAGF